MSVDSLGLQDLVLSFDTLPKSKAAANGGEVESEYRLDPLMVEVL